MATRSRHTVQDILEAVLEDKNMMVMMVMMVNDETRDENGKGIME